MLAYERRHVGAEVRLDAVVSGVELEVLHHLLAARVARPVPWHRQAGQRRRRLRRVQVQPIVVMAPRRGDGRLTLEHLVVDAGVLEAGRRSEPRRRRPDDQRPRLPHIRHAQEANPRVCEPSARPATES